VHLHLTVEGWKRGGGRHELYLVLGDELYFELGHELYLVLGDGEKSDAVSTGDLLCWRLTVQGLCLLG